MTIMRLIIPLVLLSCHFLTISCKELDTNDISQPPPPINLDSNLRKALLKALTELENEEQEKFSAEQQSQDRNHLLDSTENTHSDKTFERAHASAVSIIANANEEDSPIIATTFKADAETTKRPLIVVQKSDGVQHKSITTFLRTKNPDPVKDTEQFLASASNSFTTPSNHKNELVQTRSVNSNNINGNSVFVNDKSISSGSKQFSVSPKGEFTSPAPTVPSPTTEESEAKAEDVQFFSAPLVAAFTVHQDAQGVPNKVEPIYKQQLQSLTTLGVLDTTSSRPITTQIFNQNSLGTNLNHLQGSQNNLQTQNNLQSNNNNLQSNTNNFLSSNQQQTSDFGSSHVLLQEKQKALEQHIYNLQQQQKKQQEFLLQQQHFLQEQELRINTQRIINEQNRLRQNAQPFIPLPSLNSNKQINNQNQLGISGTQLGNNQNQLGSNQNQLGNNQNQLGNTQNLGTTQVHIGTSQSLNSGQNHLGINQNTLSTSQGQFDFNSNRFKNSNSGNTVVSLQPSLSITQTQQQQLLQNGVLPKNAQILPVKSAVDFLQSPFGQGFSQQFHETISPPAQQSTFNSGFQSFPNTFSQSLPSASNNNRFFRQENTVGNFGNGNNFNSNSNFNSNRNSFTQFPSNQAGLSQNSNRVFRSNLEGVQTGNFGQQQQQGVSQYQQGPYVNQQLNNLLFQSGISRGVRQSEDLGIVSKILSYNVGRDNLFARVGNH